MNRLAAFFGTLVFSALPVSSIETTVTLAAGEAVAASEVSLVVIQAGGVVQPITGSTSLVPGEIVTCFGEGVWCPRLLIDRTHPSEIVVPAYARTSFEVVLELPRGENWYDEEVRIQGWIRQADRSKAPLQFVEEASVFSSRSRAKVIWPGPLGEPVDLRLAPSGWMPHYWFDLKAKSEMDLGTLRLNRGASLSAFAVDETGAPIMDARASVQHLYARSQDERAQRTHARGTTNEQGFVQILAAEPGVYDLVLESDGRPPTRLTGVVLGEGTETWLGNVEMKRYGQFTIQVEPASDQGIPWRVEALQFDPEWHEVNGHTDDRGLAVLTELIPGEYWIRVLDADGDEMASANRVVGSNDKTWFVELSFARVRGQVLMGRNGLQSTVGISAGAGSSASFETDFEGRFQGRIPEPAKETFLVSVETDSISRDLSVEPVLQGGVYELTVSLGQHKITGRVVDAGGLRVEGATVELALDPDDNLVTDVRFTDDDGRFVFQGLDDGMYAVSAALDGHGHSGSIQIAASESATDLDDITIVLHLGSTVDVLVVSENGIPHRGAGVTIVTLGSQGARSGFATTDLGGRAQVFVPQGTGPASVVVRSPSSVLWSGCAVLPEDGTELLVQLPTGPGGTLLLHPSNDLSIDQPSQALITIDGGLLTLDALMTWMSAQAPHVTPGKLEVSRIAPNHYAIVDLPDVGLAAYPIACAGGLRPVDAWQFLSGSGVLKFPLRFSSSGVR